LTSTPVGQDGLCRRVEIDASTAGRCLRRDLDGSAADALSAARYREAVRRTIPVGPAESCDLSAPHARGGSDMQGGVKSEMGLVTNVWPQTIVVQTASSI
jgi:hypothetical protein